MNPKILKIHSEAEKIKIKNIDFNNYMLGSYIRIAVASIMDKQAKYPKKPYLSDIDKEVNVQKFDDDLFMAQLKQWADKHNANFRAKKDVKNKEMVNNNDRRAKIKDKD